MTKRSKSPTRWRVIACACLALTPGSLCAACAQLGNGGWPADPKHGSGKHLLSDAQRSRIHSGNDQPDFFEIERKEAQRTSARVRDRGSERYEIVKGDVRRKATNSTQYEQRIKAATKRIRY